MTLYESERAETRWVDGELARYAYRRFGVRGGVPLVLTLRFRGTIDHWDPYLLDLLAAERDVIVFDNVGTGRSSGTPPRSVEGLTRGATDFLDALGLTTVDLLGWSMGGYVAQCVALLRPARVHRLVVVGSGPGGTFPGLPPTEDRVWEAAFREENTDEDFLLLFFPEDDAARDAGRRSLRRLDRRLADPGHAEVSPEAVRAQIETIRSFEGNLDLLGTLATPTLVVNGVHDVMIPAYASFAMAQRLPHARTILYGDAGHGVLFQHPEAFSRDVLDFLRGDDSLAVHGTERDALADRVARLEAVEQIGALKARYFRYVDEKRPDDLLGVFTPDAHLVTDGVEWSSPEQFVATVGSLVGGAPPRTTGTCPRSRSRARTPRPPCGPWRTCCRSAPDPTPLRATAGTATTARPTARSTVTGASRRWC
nr:alpha/beta fold hydrolase [Cellulosimicrobium sp. CUA-896]